MTLRSLLAPLALALAVTTGALTPTSTARAHERVRPRLALSVQGEGGGFVGGAEGAMGGLALRLGVRVGMVSIYGLSHGLVGALTAGREEGSATGLSWNAAMLGLHVGVFEIAAGPSLDFAWGCESGQGCYHGDFLLGINGRLALHFGPLLISADIHPTWVNDDVVLGLVGGFGFQTW